MGVSLARKFDLLVFDLDGTLIDNRDAIRENFNYVLHALNYQKIRSEQIDSMIGASLPDMFSRAAPGIKNDEAHKMAEMYRDRYNEVGHVGISFLEGVPDILSDLRKAGFKLAIATTKVERTAVPLLKKINLYKHFDFVAGGREDLRSKPNPDMLNYVMKSLAVGPKLTAMIGDTPLDVGMARNAGVYSIAVLSGVRLGITSLDDIQASKPNLTIESLKELQKHVSTKQKVKS